MTSSFPSARSRRAASDTGTATGTARHRWTGKTSRSEPARSVELLARIGAWCYDHRKAAVGIWFAALVVVFAAAGAIGAAYDASPDVPASESADGFDVLERYFPELGAGGGVGNDRLPRRPGHRRPRRDRRHGGALRHRERRVPRCGRQPPAPRRHRRLPLRRARRVADRPPGTAGRTARLRPGQPDRRCRPDRVGGPRRGDRRRRARHRRPRGATPVARPSPCSNRRRPSSSGSPSPSSC